MMLMQTNVEEPWCLVQLGRLQGYRTTEPLQQGGAGTDKGSCEILKVVGLRP